jgi:hypothetical protein
MDTIAPTGNARVETGSGEVITSPLIPALVIHPIPEEKRRLALEGIPKLRALREEILASQGGKPISLAELLGELDEAPVTQEPEEPWISLEQIVNALHKARAAHERGE